MDAPGSRPAWFVVMPDDATAFAAPQRVLNLFQVCVDLSRALSNVGIGAAPPATAAIAAEMEAASPLAFPLLLRAGTGAVEACGLDTARRLADMCVQQRAPADAAMVKLAQEANGDAPVPRTGAALPATLDNLLTRPGADDAAADRPATPPHAAAASRLRPPSRSLSGMNSDAAEMHDGGTPARMSMGGPTPPKPRAAGKSAMKLPSRGSSMF